MSNVLRTRRVSISGHEEEERSKKRKEGCTAIASQVMQDPDILVNVFKFLDFTRLKLCRTVCKTWNEEICRELKNKSVSYVIARDYPRFMRMVEKGGETQELPKLVRDVALHVKDSFMLSDVTPVPLPLTKLTVDGSTLRTNATRAKLLSLLSRSSSTLKSLKLPFCNIIPPNANENNRKLDFPVLEELCIGMGEGRLDSPLLMREPSAVAQDEDDTVSFFSNLIDSSPNLRRLEITSQAGPIAKFMKTFKWKQLSNLSIRVTQKKDAIAVSTTLKSITFGNLKSLFLIPNDFKNSFMPSDIREIVQRNTQSLESLSLDVLTSLPVCPRLKHLTVDVFTKTCLNLTSFPALSSIRVRKFIAPLPTTLPEATYCPSSLRKVEIIPEEQSWSAGETLKKLYHFFSSSVTDWEVPEENVKDFCNIFSLTEGNEIRRLAIGFNYNSFPKYCYKDFATKLEKIGNLRGLEELTVKNRSVELLPEFWKSFNPEALPNNLKKFTFYNYSKLGELKKFATKLKRFQSVVLLHDHPVPLETEAEEFFSAVPGVTVRYEADIFKDIKHEEPGWVENLNTDNYNALWHVD